MPKVESATKESPTSQADRERFMSIALLEGRKGLGLTSPNPPVGAVLVDSDDRILGKGYHLRAGTPHAEIHAINNATEQFGAEALRGADLYVTLEPCSTEGRTPACCDAIIEAGIGRVFVGTTDPNPDHAGAAIPILKEAGIEVSVGLLEEDANYLIRFFRRRIETGLPWVIAKTALTLDGHTTLPPERGPWISSEQSREDVQFLRRQVDAILVGGETVRADNPRLTLRGKFAEGREQPERIVVTATKDLPQDAGLFNDEFADRTHVYHGQPLEKVLKDLGKAGYLLRSDRVGGKSLFPRDRPQVDRRGRFLHGPDYRGRSQHGDAAQRGACRPGGPHGGSGRAGYPGDRPDREVIRFFI